MEYPQKYGRPGNSKTYCSDTVMLFNERANCSLPCYIKKKGNTAMRMRILMSFKKFNDYQKDSPCAVSSYME